MYCQSLSLNLFLQGAISLSLYLSLPLVHLLSDDLGFYICGGKGKCYPDGPILFSDKHTIYLPFDSVVPKFFTVIILIYEISTAVFSSRHAYI